MSTTNATTTTTTTTTSNDNGGLNLDDSRRGPGFSTVENLLICKAFISASEDPIVGRSQKGKVFKSKMFAQYNKLVEIQSVYDRTMMANSSSATRQVYVAATGNAGGSGLYPIRKENSVFERFTKKIAPEVSKFMGVLETTPKDSGTTDEDHYITCLTVFQQRYGHAFEFADCQKYLETKAKFTLYRQKSSDEEQQKKENETRPVGNKAAKKAKQDAALIKQCLDGMKEKSPSDLSSNSGDHTVGNVENGTENFYSNASLFLSKTGDALMSYIQQQQTILEQQNEKEILGMLPTPEKKELLLEKQKLYITELRAKRQKLETLFDATNLDNEDLTVE
jgi:hypothetical protein